MFIENYFIFIPIFEALNQPKQTKPKSNNKTIIDLDSNDTIDTINLTKQFSSKPLKILPSQESNLFETHALDIPTQNKKQKKIVISKLFEYLIYYCYKQKTMYMTYQ